MHAKRWSIAIAIVLLSLWVSGCSKTSSNAAQAPDSATQTSVEQANNNVGGAPSANGPGGTAGQPNATQASPEPLTIPAGTPVTVRLQQSLSSASAVPGERFEAVVDEPIVIENR